ncbi:MAG: NAD(P)/FAD-dependent oxidoreductase [Proteobacteria bacterium]|nr:NAD(P)/FAD-dependent oxidoreductase [Pseudomonadota bacterium]
MDLAVIGGGPAGLCAALAASRMGLSVRVYEPRQAPIDKACGEGLMPAGVAAIRALGVELDGYPFVGVRYVQGSASAVGTFATGPGLGIRRTRLHAALHQSCVDAGVHFVDRAVHTLDVDGDSVPFTEGPARYVAVADGLSSPLRRSLELELPTPWPERMGLRQHFATAPWTDHVEVHWSARCEAYVTPVADDEVGVALLVAKADLPSGNTQQRFDTLLQDFPKLAARLGDSRSSVRGAGPFARNTRSRTRGRALLIGDAAGYLDPLTGEGLRLAAECAGPLARAVRDDDPARYEREWTRIMAPYFRATGALLRLASNRWTRPCIVPVASRVPGLMDRSIRVLGD